MPICSLNNCSIVVDLAAVLGFVLILLDRFDQAALQSVEFLHKQRGRYSRCEPQSGWRQGRQIERWQPSVLIGVQLDGLGHDQ